mgnify:CR=1 FL=1
MKVNIYASRYNFKEDLVSSIDSNIIPDKFDIIKIKNINYTVNKRVFNIFGDKLYDIDLHVIKK